MNGLKSKDTLAAFWAGIIAFILLVCAFYGTDAEVYLFPRIAAVCIALLAAILIFDAFKNRASNGIVPNGIVPNGIAPNGTGGEPESGQQSEQKIVDWSPLLPGLIVGIIYILSIEIIGFYAGSFLAFLGITMLYGQRKALDPQAIIYKVMVATIFMAVLYLLFWNLLHVRTPSGLLM